MHMDTCIRDISLHSLYLTIGGEEILARSNSSDEWKVMPTDLTAPLIRRIGVLDSYSL